MDYVAAMIVQCSLKCLDNKIPFDALVKKNGLVLTNARIGVETK